MISILVSIAVGTAALYLYAKWSGGIKKNNLRDWVFVLAFALIVLILGGLSSLRAEPQAGWFKYTTVYAGLDYHFSRANPQCVTEDPIRDQLNSSGGVIQNIFEWSEPNVWSSGIDLGYQHHSCAIVDDSDVYDGIGIRAQYTIYW